MAARNGVGGQRLVDDLAHHFLPRDLIGSLISSHRPELCERRGGGGPFKQTKNIISVTKSPVDAIEEMS
jgi:hypothetical protein